ncbi:MAG TPA: tail fiber domain-containing protein [Pyrinomonadaceae bacterium]|nr:tail fiber domain-containing protein [Pyrinomonadaceae bacterium]
MTTLRRTVLSLVFVFALALVCHAQQEEPTATTTGSGTASKIAKFTAATVLGDSIMTENTGKIGINVAPPTATLHVNGLQPAPLATNGTTPAMLLQTSGGKGGNTTGSGKKAGAGASILLAAGDGGDTAPNGTKGNGGNITLRPGAAGTGGGFPAPHGNVLLAPTHGLVGIGLTGPNAKLDIIGQAGLDINQSLSAVLRVTNNFNGLGSPNPAVAAINDDGVAISGTSQTSRGVLGMSDSGDGVNGVSQTGIGVRGENTHSNYGVFGKSFLGTAVYGEGTNGTGVKGKSTGNFGTGVFGEGYTGVAGTSPSNSLLTAGVFGENTGGGYGVQGISTSGVGVRGEGATGVQGISSGTGTAVYGQNPGNGYAGQFLGKTRFTANMEIGGNELFGNTTRQMLNLYNLDYAIGVQNNTLYFRSAVGYNWYKGGVHNNTQNSPGTGGTSLMRLDLNGNLVVKGSVTATNFVNSSDRAVKSNFAIVNPRAVLDRLASVPVQTWSYKSEGETVRHMGPMAQDFKAAFNLGTDDKTISTVDSAGVTMAAIQGLYQMMLEKEQRNEELLSEVRDLRAQVTRLERAVKGPRRTARRNRTR